MSLFFTRRRRLYAVGAVVVALCGIAAARRAASGRDAPESNGFEISISGATAVAPGGTLSFDGSCWSSELGPAERASMQGRREADPGGMPFAFAAPLDVGQRTGAISGSIAVPDIAPDGAYRFELSCSTQGQILGGAETPFAVESPATAMTIAAPTASSIVPPEDR